ncbi:MAG: TIGR04282 family arsenosugar biosynthesis glycosyltransferase [Magnetococcales bacterium]|nr:TIGR04282 family arsenosugar biosynthesis glycosyltransferase [Magnetococcales bacterium]
MNLLGRAPEPGCAKTRLIPALGVEGAALAHAVLLTHVATQARRWCVSAGSGVLFRLWGTPDCSAPLFSLLAHPDERNIQPPGDFGERLAHIARSGLAEADAVMLLGGDAVSLDSSTLEQAAEVLSRHPAVLIPAADGGYVLLGLRRFAPELFDAIPWGSDRVAEATRQALRALDWSWEELPGHWDVDLPEDWERFRRLEKSWSDNC